MELSKLLSADSDLLCALEHLVGAAGHEKVVENLAKMDAPARLDTVSKAYTDLCRKSTELYEDRLESYHSWERLLFWFVAVTLILIVAGVLLIFANYLTVAKASGALGLLSGVTAAWCTAQIRKQYDLVLQAFQQMSKYCSKAKLIEKLKPMVQQLEEPRKTEFVDRLTALDL